MSTPKITLVELPPTEHGELDGKLINTLFIKYLSFARGLHLLDAELHQAGFTDTKVISPGNAHSGELKKRYWDRLVSSDFLALSTITLTAGQTEALARAVRRENPGVKIIAGGPHVTYMIEDTLKWADVVVRREGDATLPELIEKLWNGGTPEGVLGTSYKKDEAVVSEAERPALTLEELSKVPVPRYDADTLDKMEVIPVNTERGCPFPCDFCSVNDYYGKVTRRRSNESTIAELKQVYDLPQKFIFFTDDNFAPDLKTNHAQTKDLLRRMIREGMTTKKISAQMRVEAAFDPELLKLFTEVGGVGVYLGLESMDKQSLKEMKKGSTPEKNMEAVSLYRKAGIWVHGMFIFGLDWDTPESLDVTMDWAKRDVDSMQIFAPIPLPGTTFANRMKSQGRILTEQYNLYDAQHVILNPRNFTPYDLQMRIFDKYEQFYTHRRRWRTLFSEFFRSPKMALFGGLGVYPYALKTLEGVLKSPQTTEHIEYLKDFDNEKAYSLPQT